MKTKAFRFAAGGALLGLGATLPAHGQFLSNYPVIIVPPPAQNYVLPKPTPKPPPDKPKPADTPAQAAPAPGYHYQGRALVPD